jgi:hypothetical protein
LEKIFNEARDARAEWVTSERSGGGLVQDTDAELTSMGVGEQMQQMFFGNLFRRKPKTGREGQTSGSSQTGRGGRGSR